MSKFIHAPHTLKDTCTCGHAKETHYQQSGACLGMHCDDCDEYDNASSPKLPPTPPSTPATDPVLPAEDDPSVAPVAPFYYPWAYPPAPTYPPYSPTGTP